MLRKNSHASEVVICKNDSVSNKAEIRRQSLIANLTQLQDCLFIAEDAIAIMTYTQAHNKNIRNQVSRVIIMIITFAGSYISDSDQQSMPELGIASKFSLDMQARSITASNNIYFMNHDSIDWDDTFSLHFLYFACLSILLFIIGLIVGKITFCMTNPYEYRVKNNKYKLSNDEQTKIQKFFNLPHKKINMDELNSLLLYFKYRINLAIDDIVRDYQYDEKTAISMLGMWKPAARQLPDEISVKIASYLNHKDIFNVLKTAKTFKNISKNLKDDLAEIICRKQKISISK